MQAAEDIKEQQEDADRALKELSEEDNKDGHMPFFGRDVER